MDSDSSKSLAEPCYAFREDGTLCRDRAFKIDPARELPVCRAHFAEGAARDALVALQEGQPGKAWALLCASQERFE
jgi:hypothetical protein